MIDARQKAVTAINQSFRSARDAAHDRALSGAVRALAWAVLYVGDQIQGYVRSWGRE